VELRPKSSKEKEISGFLNERSLKQKENPAKSKGSLGMKPKVAGQFNN
jgi:hypothetical protein